MNHIKQNIKIGRPSLYTEELADEICRRLYETEGHDMPLTLKEVCDDPSMPSLSTVHSWLSTKPAFKKAYEIARGELRLEAMMCRYLHMAKEAKNAAYGTPGTGEASARVQGYRIEIDALKWLITKEYSRSYGDNVKLDPKVEPTYERHRDSQELLKLFEAWKKGEEIAATVEPPAAYRDLA